MIKKINGLIPIFLIISLYIVIINPVMSQNNYWINLELNPDIYILHNEQLNITITGNFSFCQVEFWNNNTLIGSYIQDVNTTKTLIVYDSYPYGEYEIKAIINENIVTCFLTVLDITEWKSVSFPYEKSHKNIDYSFFSNGTLKAKQGNNVLNIDLSTIRILIDYYNLDVTATYNDMNFRINVKKEGIVNINLVFSFIHTGCKFMVSGELDKPRILNINIKNPDKLKQLTNFIRKENIVFDYSDLKKTSYFFSYDNGILNIDLPKTFSFDPIIFSDGFESGDFSEWDGITGSPATSSAYAHHGIYSAQINAAETVYEGITSTADARYIRAYIYFTALPTSDYYSVGVCGFAPEGFHGYPFFATAYKDPADSTVKYALRNAYVNSWNITSIQVATGGWTYVEVKYIKSGTGELYLNGTLRATLSCPPVNTDYSFVGSPEGTQGTGYIDCVVISDEYIGFEIEEEPEDVITIDDVLLFSVIAFIIAMFSFVMVMTHNRKKEE